MLHRLRNSVRRWPRLALWLVLGSFAGQGLAGTLSWCLHGSADPHVMSSVGPCHDVAGAAAGEREGHGGAPVDHGHHDHPTGHPVGDSDGPAGHDGLPCHGAASHMAHVSAAPDAASGASAVVPAPAPALVWWQPPQPVDAPALAQLAASGPSLPGGDPRPRLSGALPGVSARLLI